MSSILVNASIVHLNGDDRKQALSMLLLLGLSKYSGETQCQSIDLNSLKHLHGKALVELGDGSARHFDKKAKSTSSINATEKTKTKPKPLIPYRTQSAGSGRSPRPNATTAYPFADDENSTKKLLDEPPAGPAFYMLGAPSRKRVAAKVFQDFAQGHNTMRLIEVPDAFEVLGLKVSEEVRKAFKNQHELAALNMLEGQGGGVRPKLNLEEFLKTTEKYTRYQIRLLEEERNVDIQQRAQEKLKRLGNDGVGGISLLNRQEGIELVNAIIDSSGIEENDGLNAVDSPVEKQKRIAMEEAEIEEAAQDAFHKALGKGILEAKYQLSQIPDDERKDILEGNTNRKITTATRNRLEKQIGQGISSKKTIKRQNTRGKAIVKETLASKMRNVQSKIANDVRKDKIDFKQKKMNWKDPAMKSIARTKVDAISNVSYTSIDYPDKNTKEDLEQRNAIPLRETPQSIDLKSGSASMQIADAFLKGPIGQEMTSTENDYSLDLSHGGTGDYRESKGRTEQGEIEAMLESTFLLPPASTTKESTERAMSVGVKIHEKPHQVPENWELKSGGYVAEFGQGSNWNK